MVPHYRIHDYLLGLSDSVLDTIENPEMVLKGEKDELITTKQFKNKALVVLYKEVTKEDGFMEKGLIKEVGKFVPGVMKISKQMWIDYDKEADVIYISFEKPQHADDSIMEDNVIIHKKKNKIVGLTILHASEFGS